jgi:hypothetical protein
MTVAGTTAQPLQPAAPFARWSAVLAAGLGCLALAVDRRFNRARYDADLIVAAFAARLPDTADPDATRLDLGETAEQALEPEHLSLWMGEVAS